MTFWRKLGRLAQVCCIALVVTLVLALLMDEKPSRSEPHPPTQTFFEN